MEFSCGKLRHAQKQCNGPMEMSKRDSSIWKCGMNLRVGFIRKGILEKGISLEVVGGGSVDKGVTDKSRGGSGAFVDRKVKEGMICLSKDSLNKRHVRTKYDKGRHYASGEGALALIFRRLKIKRVLNKNLNEEYAVKEFQKIRGNNGSIIKELMKIQSEKKNVVVNIEVDKKEVVKKFKKYMGNQRRERKMSKKDVEVNGCVRESFEGCSI
ncbi:hypothetical protein GOBAR_AA04562 [Gossypium barbadense]|uniref:Uncharacterized protein n=1 Tax=Gossypium barbadense TaxID=3634 RepID=A0A2P5YK91_GOSBA|nr:hypothetical protein GOBAR_AA04562 [Gossypium barbadense]